MKTTERSCRDLLLASVRDSTDAGQLRSLAEKVGDWNGLVDLALQHCVLPMLFSRLTDLEAYVPASAADRMQREYARIVVHNLANAAELVGVLESFDREGIQAMPFKGVVLAASAYGDLLKRPGGDLDFLARKCDLPCATRVLQERGYVLETALLENGEPEEPGIHEYKFRRRADGMELELRWRLDLNWDRYGRDLGMDWVWPRRATTTLAGAVVPVLSPEISLLVLCMHGCKHFWSRLVWVCDIGKVISASPDLDWAAIVAESKRLGLWRALGLGVLLTERLLQAGFPSDILDLFEQDKTTQSLASHFADNLLDNPGMGPPGRVPYGLQLLDFRDRARLFLSGDFLRPNERDQRVIDLPARLRPLYYLVRPFRLLWDRSSR